MHDYLKRSREKDKYGGHQNPLGACIVNVCWRTFRFLGFYRKAVVMIAFFFLFPSISVGHFIRVIKVK